MGIVTLLSSALLLQVPSLVLGPFGCGKTKTLFECVKLLTMNVPDVRVLICTHSNSAADLYVRHFHREWMGRHNNCCLAGVIH